MATRKKATAKKSTRGKKASGAKRIKTINAPMSKTQVMTAIAGDTGLTKSNVSAVLDSLGDVIHGHVRKGGAGTFTVPGLMKIKTVHKPATKAREGVNPFTGEPTVFKAKPARTVVKILPLKRLKDMAG
jgi:nucleoid DNA-binding protein